MQVALCRWPKKNASAIRYKVSLQGMAPGWKVGADRLGTMNFLYHLDREIKWTLLNSTDRKARIHFLLHLWCWKNIVGNHWAPVCCIDIKKEVNWMTLEEFVDLLHTTNRRRRTLPSSAMSLGKWEYQKLLTFWGNLSKDWNQVIKDRRIQDLQAFHKLRDSQCHLILKCTCRPYSAQCGKEHSL